jgi:ABC-type bacteriocin/lantibiotic exporter with double-glycine peptidase domain
MWFPTHAHICILSLRFVYLHTFSRHNHHYHHHYFQFEDVSFKYEGMRKAMLKGVSFTVPAGSFCGICGERGTGKSTLFKLLLRL